jgi:hypothetical protein
LDIGGKDEEGFAQDCDNTDRRPFARLEEEVVSPYCVADRAIASTAETEIRCCQLDSTYTARRFDYLVEGSCIAHWKGSAMGTKLVRGSSPVAILIEVGYSLRDDAPSPLDGFGDGLWLYAVVD